MRQLPKGHSDFKKIRQGGLYYVDKSLFIAEIIADKTEVILLPRPRRFGKTINLSLLKYFFQGQDSAANRTLFEGLKIVDNPYFETHQGRYPIIDLSFKGVKALTFTDSLANIKRLLQAACQRHAYLRTSERLSTIQRADFEQLYSGKAPMHLWQNALKDLSSYLATHYQAQVVILIDEYDTPIQAAWLKEYYEEMIDFMRVFLGEGLKGNVNLYKSVITGIMRVSKESIFSGLNNIGVYSLVSKNYADKFGFTEAEVELLIKDFALEEQEAILRNWYNGYKVGIYTIYNPWSIVNYINDKEDFPRPYWINTSDNGLIRQLIFDSNLNVHEEIEDLIQGKGISKRLDENIVFRDLESDEVSLFSFLYFAGYLKHEKLYLVNNKLHGDLRIPNEEVKIFYEDVIQSWIKHSPAKNNAIQQLLKALLNAI